VAFLFGNVNNKKYVDFNAYPMRQYNLENVLYVNRQSEAKPHQERGAMNETRQLATANCARVSDAFKRAAILARQY
jgi:hypothetical protein